MIKKISLQLTAIISLLCLTTLISQATITQYSFNQGLENYIDQRRSKRMGKLALNFVNYYEVANSWSSLNEDTLLWKELSNGNHISQPQKKQIARKNNSNNKGLSLSDENNNYIAGNFETFNAKLAKPFPIYKNSQIIGYLLSPAANNFSEKINPHFSKHLVHNTISTAIILILISITTAFGIAKWFVKPIHRLNKGADLLMQGDYTTKITPIINNEIGEATEKFNQLATVLKNKKTNQQRFISNTSHELRTPIAILKSELDVLKAGLQPIGQEQIASLFEETDRLSHLIDQLFLLSLSDSDDLKYEFKRQPLIPIIKKIIKNIGPTARKSGLTINLELPNSNHELLVANIDCRRFSQLLMNVLCNSCKYTDSPGKINLKINFTKSNNSQNYCEITIDDSAPGLTNDSLEKIFYRLYREETSRNRDYGGAGLGLAISQSIALAHKGELFASHSNLGGISICLKLPL